MSAKILFIGGTGTISTACVHHAVKQGLDVSILVRGNRDHRLPPGITVLHGDIRKNFDEVRKFLGSKKWDAVVDWVAFEEADILQDFELFKNSTDKFFFISSTSVYSKPLPPRFLTENSPIGKTGWDYADKKASCENILQKLYAEKKFPMVIIRPGATYSEFVLPTAVAGLGYGLIERLKQKKPLLIHDDGKVLWTLTFNEDFARGLVPLLTNPSIIGETFHITADERISWTEIHQMIAETFGFETPSFEFIPSSFIQKIEPDLAPSFLSDKCHNYLFDNAKIKNYVPNFSAKISLREGLLRCARWYQQSPFPVTFNQESDRRVDHIIKEWKSHG